MYLYEPLHSWFKHMVHVTALDIQVSLQSPITNLGGTALRCSL